jgi:hypothetical protein
MKLAIFVILGFAVTYCGNMSASSNDQRSLNATDDKSGTIVDNFSMRLKNREGRCILIYSAASKTTHETEVTADTGIAAPCEFIRQPGGDHKPMSYSYQTGQNRRSVLLITGGKPEPSIKDQYQPGGCGTSLQKIRVFSNRIEVDETPLGPPGPARCPSTGADEMEFSG